MITNEKMREISGDIKEKDYTAVLLYILMRDFITPGKMERAVMEVEKLGNRCGVFTNGWLGQYANHLSGRLK